MSLDTYLIFAIASLITVLTPGAATIAIASQGASNGTAKALAGVCGIAGANAIYFVLSATGIASLILASHMVFLVIKWVGVAYLAWLGLNALFRSSLAVSIDKKGSNASRKALFLQGAVIEFANPKALLYFAAIVPQFLDLQAPILPQFLIMGVTTLILDLIVCSFYAHLGSRLASGSVKGWVATLANKAAGGALLFAAFRMIGVSASR